MIIGLLIMLGLIVLMETYAFRGIYTSISEATRWLVYGFTVFWFLLVLAQWGGMFLVGANFERLRTENPQILMIGAAFFFTMLIPKMILSTFHLLDDLRFLGAKVFASKPSAGGTVVSRSTFLTTIGQASAALMFGAVLYGVTKGKYNYKLKTVKIEDDAIPTAWKGTKIVQFSDAHLGSFMENFEDVQRGIDIINSLDADYVLFTGDLVNNVSTEAEPWIETFKGIKAKKGKYSVMGNHDYADYGRLPEEDRIASRNRLREIEAEMGFQMLNNENVQLEKDGEIIDLIGVENWGDSFRRSGDLDQAMVGTDPNRFQILMSHDPSHFEKKVLGQTLINLTLSGHTHGMQFGVEIPFLNLKWSPVKLRYKYWDGLYAEGKQKIHVNRGFGFLGFPGRVGMWPEITCLELV